MTSPCSIIIDTLPFTKVIVQELLKEKEIAVHLEIVTLPGEDELISLLAIQSNKGTYVFDILALGRDAFDKGRLKELFESELVLKIFFDSCRSMDALLRTFQVNVVNYYDVQILYLACFESVITCETTVLPDFYIVLKKFFHHLEMDESRKSEFLASNSEIFFCSPEHHSLESFLCRYKTIKDSLRGKQGSYARKNRPLPGKTLEFIEDTTRLLYQIRNEWGHAELDAYVLRETFERCETFSKSKGSSRFPTGSYLSIPKEDYNREGNITYVINVPLHKIGRVIGRKGSNLNNVQTKTNTKIRQIDLPDGKFAIFGLPSNVDEACKYVMSVLDNEDSVVKSIIVPCDKIGYIIGKQGATIRTIQDQTNTKIYQTQPSGPMFSICGSISNVNCAYDCIVDILRDVKEKQEAVKKVITVQRRMIGKIIGKEGSNIKKIESETNTKIIQESRNFPELTIWGSPSDVEKACEWIWSIEEPQTGHRKTGEPTNLPNKDLYLLTYKSDYRKTRARGKNKKK